MAEGIVTSYDEEEGVGTISTEALPAGQDAWVHFSAIEGDGYRTLTVGEVVDVELEQVRQDGFDHRAARVRRRPPAGAG